MTAPKGHSYAMFELPSYCRECGLPLVREQVFRQYHPKYGVPEHYDVATCPKWRPESLFKGESRHTAVYR